MQIADVNPKGDASELPAPARLRSDHLGGVFPESEVPRGVRSEELTSLGVIRSDGLTSLGIVRSGGLNSLGLVRSGLAGIGIVHIVSCCGFLIMIGLPLKV